MADNGTPVSMRSAAETKFRPTAKSLAGPPVADADAQYANYKHESNEGHCPAFGVAMRYFFNLAGAVHNPDNEGLELAQLSDAREHAVRAAAEYIRDRHEIVWLGEEFRMEVTNGDRLILFTLIVVGVDAPAIRAAS